jgi:hypothetical protein
MGERVKRVRTEVSETQMAQAILESWKDLFKETPTKQQVALVLSQNALETGHRKQMWNYNVGNITTDGKGSFDYYDDLATDEQIKPGVWKKMNLKYRAYPSLNDGVKDYLRLLSSKHYGNAWQHIKNPDPTAFSKALKQSGYYTANEAPYTKTLNQLYTQFNKSNSYEQAQSGKAAPSSVATLSNKPSVPTDLTNLMDKYLHMVAASEQMNKRLYKQLLPKTDIVIQVNSSNYTNDIEFARILCTALEENLLADSYTHTDGRNVEIECAIHGPPEDCFDAVKQLTESVAEAFSHATKKIGSIVVKTNCIMDKKSSYQEISAKTADTNYRSFLLKFI